MLKLNYLEAMGQATERMSKGGVLLTVAGDTPNTMTIGWGAIGFSWNKPMMMVMVRPSRHTFGLLNKAGRFSVSVPRAGDLKEELMFAGTESGRTVDKFQGHGLTCAPGLTDGIKIVAECPLHIECVVRHVQDMTGDLLDENVRLRAYPKGDLHRLYFGEIMECYRTDQS